MRAKNPGFTLIELLVVIAIISLLMAILLPSLQKAKLLTTRLSCGSNLRQIGMAVLFYTEDNQGNFPAHQRTDTTSWPYIFNDWAIRHTNFSKARYLPIEASRRDLFFCKEGLETIGGGNDPNWTATYNAFPNSPPTTSNVTISYCYFMGLAVDPPYAGTTGRHGQGRMGDVTVDARTTMLADLMRFGQTYPYEPVTSWNHVGRVDGSLEEAGGNMVYVDGHVAWMQGRDNLLSHRQKMNNSDIKSYCAEQPQ